MPAHPGPGREEIDQPQGVFMDTPLKIAVDKASRLLDGFAEEDEEKFQEAIGLVDQRVVTTTRAFFEIMRQGGATMRLVTGTADWSFGEDAIARAVDRTESTTVEQEKETLDGQLAEVLPDGHQFEFRIADAKIPIGGAVDRAISATELANFNRTWVNVDARARFSVKRIRHNDDIC